MKIARLIAELRVKMNGLKSGRLTGRESFIAGITKSNSFLQLTLQEKIIFIAHLIALIQADYGFTPDVLIRSLSNLNQQLNHELFTSFMSQYSH